MKVRITNQELRYLLDAQTPEFPKYASQLINLAALNAQATRPKVVGQMSQLIQEFPGEMLEEWEKWYLERHPEAPALATQKICDMLEKFRSALDKIDRETVEKWVKDLLIVKTFIGLRFQEAILKKLAAALGRTYRLVTAEEEAKGIDGFLGKEPVSIKPLSYKSKMNLSEEIASTIIFYEKRKNGLIIEWMDEE